MSKGKWKKGTKPKKNCLSQRGEFNAHLWEVLDTSRERCVRCMQIITDRAAHSARMKKLDQIRREAKYNEKVHKHTTRLVFMLSNYGYEAPKRVTGHEESDIANALYHMRYDLGFSLERIWVLLDISQATIEYYVRKYPWWPEMV